MNQMKIGEIFELEVIAQNPHGDGIAKRDDFVIFVKSAKKGDKCKVRITDVKRTYAVGEKV